MKCLFYLSQLIGLNKIFRAKLKMSGPDFVFPAENLTTWDANGFTKIKMPKDDDQNIPPKSLVTAVKQACEEGGSLIAFKQKIDGDWKEWSFQEYYRDIMCMARAFIKLGLEERHSVCISGFNSPEWFLSLMGSIFVGGIVSKTINNIFFILNSIIN
jgi:long-chain-fatty-acid--CoA ligase ACSBG